MGCDIHWYVEVKKDAGWELAATPPEEIEGEDYKVWKEKYDKYLANPFIYWGRNYDLFAILADVRNGRGFAGIPTGTGFNPISEPRGVPEDASEAYLAMVDRYGGDGHSHSWMTVEDFDNYDWGQGTKHVGLVTLGTPIENGVPEFWCGALYGDHYGEVSREEFDKLNARIYSKEFEDRTEELKFVLATLGTIRDELGYTPVCKFMWETSYRDSVGSKFMNEVLPALRELGSPDKVRAVFFFDN